MSAKEEQQSRDAGWGEEWRETWPRVERCERTGRISYAEAFFGPLMLAMESSGAYADARRLFSWCGYTVSVGRTWPGERCFNFHRDEGCSLLFLGSVIVCVDHPRDDAERAALDA